MDISIFQRTARLLTVAAVVVMVTACSNEKPTARPQAPSTTTARPQATAPTTEPARTGRPVGIIAIGHSGLTGEGTGATFEPVLANSWATGSEPKVNSVYQRLTSVRPETQGHVANTAKGGAPASTLTAQATQALAIVPVPALAIIQTVDGDIRCDASNVAEIGKSLAQALALIHDASPNAIILVAGQLGRPSVAFVTDLVAAHPDTKADLTWDDECSFFDADGKLRESGFELLTATIDVYEAETARVCAQIPNCVTDGGVRKAWIDSLEYFSPPFTHINLAGQAAQAELIWPIVEPRLNG
jgi:hypothetical protein